jgi:hypothetical protein
MMTLKDFPGYWSRGNGDWALVCSRTKRIFLFATQEAAEESSYHNCGRGCSRYDSPHQVIRFEPAAPKPAPKISRAWRQMVEAE